MYLKIFVIALLSKTVQTIFKIQLREPSNKYDHLFESIISCRYVNKIVFLIDEDMKDQIMDMNYITQNIPYNLSVLLIGSDTKKTKSRSFWSRFSRFIFYSMETLYVIMQPRNDRILNFTKLSLFSHLKAYPQLSCSKFLIVTHEMESIRDIQATLHDAWQNKILDLTVLQDRKIDPSCISKAVFHTYNPFFRIYHEHCFRLSSIVFPRKLQDLNRYPINVLIMDFPPITNLKCDYEPNVTCEVEGIEFDIMKILSLTMNFQINVVPVFSNATGPFIYNIGYANDTALRAANVDLRGNHFFPFENDETFHARASTMILFDEICAIVPILHNRYFNINPDKIVFAVIVIMSICLLIYVLKHCLNFEKKYWDVFYILITFLNAASLRMPIRNFERILFLLVIILAHFFSSFFVRQLIDFKVSIDNEIPLNTPKDFAESDLSVVFNHIFIPKIVDPDDTFFNHLINKSVSNADDKDCINKLGTKFNAVCITHRKLAESINKKNIRFSGNKTPVFKIAKPCFWSGGLVMALEMKSPYIERINSILLLIAQGNLYHQFQELKSFQEYKYIKGEYEAQDQELLIQLRRILMLGYIVSICIFITELFKY
ncbi:uncharacterized protein LOC116417408 [Nasonia vitripennis]|uniref:Uncharacterized protein n=1 Tax=Nasonia vitripennis TaxID=7425 RepID=A0A7M7TA46_NASVI|nr:uncharacterized protein LOC116417408 [Nasonia vitripennis]